MLHCHVTKRVALSRDKTCCIVTWQNMLHCHMTKRVALSHVALSHIALSHVALSRDNYM